MVKINFRFMEKESRKEGFFKLQNNSVALKVENKFLYLGACTIDEDLLCEMLESDCALEIGTVVLQNDTLCIQGMHRELVFNNFKVITVER